MERGVDVFRERWRERQKEREKKGGGRVYWIRIQGLSSAPAGSAPPLNNPQKSD